MNGFSPAVMHNAFMIRNNKYNQRNFQCLYYINKRSTKRGTEIVTYREPQIWNLVPKKLKVHLLSKFLKRKLESGRVKSVHVENTKITFSI